MKTILILFTGGRDETDVDRVSLCLRLATVLGLEFAPKTREIHKVLVYQGGARGGDKTAERVALANGFEVREFPADWTRHGRGAGPIRNQVMVDAAKQALKDGAVSAVVCAACPGPDSIGTWDCVKRAHKARFPVYISP